VAQVWLSAGTVVTAEVGMVVVPFNGEGEEVVHPPRSKAPMQMTENTITVLSM